MVRTCAYSATKYACRDMTKPALPPNSYAYAPPMFGTDGQMKWNPVTSRAAKAESQAARLHHHVARSVRAYLEENKLTQIELAEELSWRKGRLNRLLNGSATLNIADMYALLGACGLSLTRLVGSLAADDIEPAVRKSIITAYLADQLEQLGAETSHSE